jgi:hypothetical protein
MKTMVFTILLALGTSACSAQDAPTVPPAVSDGAAQPNDILFRCDYKYDRAYNIVFLGSHRVIYHPPSLPELTVYRITDVIGGHWAINEYDWSNYTCIQTPVNGDK